MTFHRRVAASALLLGIGACALCVRVEPKGGVSLIPSAHAQGLIRNLIARLRGETLPDGIVKSNGRIEATQVDVSSKYAGRLAEVTVEEGSPVTQGQVIARISSPEYEAQLRAAQASVQKSKDALAAAEAEITSRQSALEFAKSDFERGQELMKTGFITKQVFEQRKRNYDSAVAAVQSFTSQRDQAQSGIKNAEAEVERIEFDHQRSDARFAAKWTGSIPTRPRRRGRRRRSADRHDPRPHRRLHDDLPACGGCWASRHRR